MKPGKFALTPMAAGFLRWNATLLTFAAQYGQNRPWSNVISSVEKNGPETAWSQPRGQYPSVSYQRRSANAAANCLFLRTAANVLAADFCSVLDTATSLLVTVDEALQIGRDLGHLEIGAVAELGG